jgi:catechol 2,3-dioxygenase-like lactoylglutathione lyase family enzyme
MVNLGLDHIHIYVKDLEEAIRFYKMLGLEFIEYTSHGGKAAMMRVPVSPISFEIQETRVCESYKADGIKVDGPLDNKATGRRLATIRDPHGFLIQLVQKK